MDNSSTAMVIPRVCNAGDSDYGIPAVEERRPACAHRPQPLVRLMGAHKYSGVPRCRKHLERLFRFQEICGQERHLRGQDTDKRNVRPGRNQTTVSVPACRGDSRRNRPARPHRSPAPVDWTGRDSLYPSLPGIEIQGPWRPRDIHCIRRAPCHGHIIRSHRDHTRRRTVAVSACVAILHANNTRDTETDRRAHIRTLAMDIGQKASRAIYYAEILVPFIWTAACTAVGIFPVWCLLVLPAAVPAVLNLKAMKGSRTEGPGAIGSLDEMTAKLQMTFSLLFTISFVLAYFL